MLTLQCIVINCCTLWVSPRLWGYLEVVRASREANAAVNMSSRCYLMIQSWHRARLCLDGRAATSRLCRGCSIPRVLDANAVVCQSVATTKRRHSPVW
jgi:hypothetical protein